MKRSATFARGLFSPLLYQLSYPANRLKLRHLELFAVLRLTLFCSFVLLLPDAT